MATPIDTKQERVLYSLGRGALRTGREQRDRPSSAIAKLDSQLEGVFCHRGPVIAGSPSSEYQASAVCMRGIYQYLGRFPSGEAS
ncbi:hypothetical protein DY000_02015935 [Brassica cretica]|uniref:Uncharacterized protein n=1 Tax=Brassica cretica TaxID=69181 RepID=A0ABQ7CXQ4_BRACR|nr:hypothetical protein DY000_02015935 [Brassica cretica]